MSKHDDKEPYMETHVKVILIALIILSFAAFAFNQWVLSRF